MSTATREAGTATASGQGDRWRGLGTNLAEGWEHSLVPRFRPWAERLVAAVAPTPGEAALDVACSTGLAARIAAAAVRDSGRVVGLDSAPGMIAVAEEACADVSPPIIWHVGDAQELPFEDKIFDVVVCNQGLHFFENPTTALQQMRRVLGPDGRLALGVWRRIEHMHGLRRLAEALERQLSPTAGALRCVASPWEREELRDLVSEAGFDDVHIRHDADTMRFASTEDCLHAQASSTPLGVAVSALDAGQRDTLIGNVEASLDDLLDDDGLPLLFESYLLTARR